MENNSGVSPRGRAILVQPYEIEKPEGLIVMPDSVKENLKLLQNRAVVIEIGPDAWKGETPRAQLGEKVFITKYAGFIVEGVDGEMYRLVNDNDIFAAITKE